MGCAQYGEISCFLLRGAVSLSQIMFSARKNCASVDKVSDGIGSAAAVKRRTLAANSERIASKSIRKRRRRRRPGGRLRRLALHLIAAAKARCARRASRVAVWLALSRTLGVDVNQTTCCWTWRFACSLGQLYCTACGCGVLWRLWTDGMVCGHRAVTTATPSAAVPAAYACCAHTPLPATLYRNTTGTLPVSSVWNVLSPRHAMFALPG